MAEEENERKVPEVCNNCKHGFPVMDQRHNRAYIVCERNPVRIIKNPTDHCSEHWLVHTKKPKHLT